MVIKIINWIAFFGFIGFLGMSIISLAQTTNWTTIDYLGGTLISLFISVWMDRLLKL